MKIRLRTSRNVEDFHETKRRKIIIRLTKASDRIRREELKSQKTTVAVRTPNGKLLNKAGDARGIHMREEPPERASERMKKVRAMRRFYNKQMPVPQCNGCAYSGQCPQFKAGYECSFLPFLSAHKVESVEDLFEYLKEMAGANMRRTQWALIAETLSGGAPSLETSEAYNLAFTQVKQLYELATKADSTLEIETDDKGIIGEIFGNLSNLVRDTKKAQATPIDVVPRLKDEKKGDVFLTDTDMNDAEVNTGLATEFARSQILARTGRPKGDFPEIKISDAK